MRFKNFKPTEDLFEVKMTGKNLAKLASKIPDVKIGLEFEMIVPNTDTDDDDEYLERDYDQDEQVNDIDDAVNFFDDGEYNGRTELRRLRESMENDYFEWQIEQIDERWHSDDGLAYFAEYLDREDPFDEEDAEQQARDELKAQYGDELSGEDFDQMLFALVDEKRESYAQDQWDDQGRNWENAYEEFSEEQRDEGNYSERDWLRSQGIRYMSEVESTYGHVQWPYYTRSSVDEEQDIKSVALDFLANSGLPYKRVAVGQYHGHGGGYEIWNGETWIKGTQEKPHYCFTIEPDGSLHGDDPGDAGLEFVSPPIPLDQVETVMKKVQHWAGGRGIYTGKSNATSMHTNISIPGYSIGKLDYVKAALLLGDEHVLREFDRIGNTYARPAIEKIRGIVKAKPEKAKELLDRMKSHLDAAASKIIHSGVTDKYTSINTKDNRIEFRSPGGDYLSDIGDDPKKMIDTINRMVVVMDAAMDPEKYKQEYQKKLYKALTGQQPGRAAQTGERIPAKQNDKDLINIFSRYAAGELPRQALKSFVRQAQLQRKLERGDMEGKYWWEVSNPQYSMASIRVVAKTKKEAIERALDPDGYPSWRNTINTVEAKPLKPFVDQPLKATAGEPVPLGRSSGPMLGDRPSNPDGNYVISPEQDRSAVAYRFSAANIDDAQTVVRQWREQHPDRVWIVQRDDNRTLGQPSGEPIPGSTLDLQRQRQAQQQQDPGPAPDATAYEMYRISDGRTAVGPEGNVMRFYADSLEDAESRIERLAAIFNLGAPQLFAVRSVLNAPQQSAQPEVPMGGQNYPREPAQQQGTSDQPGNWGLWVATNNRFARVPGTENLRRFSTQAAAEEFLANIQASGHQNLRTDIEVREIEPTSGFQNYQPDDWSADFERRQQTPEPVEPRTQFGGEFTGHWLIKDPTGAVIHRFGGIGNVQSDANRIAMDWLRQNPEHFQDGVEVVPEMT